ncbi:MAG: hypothetical protein SPL75_03845 [Bacilli bacterium]|nr:hypothetical protein [Bacilli bacterium]
MRNEGFNIEYDIVNTINGKKFIDLPHNLYHMVKEIFGKLDDSKMILHIELMVSKRAKKVIKKHVMDTKRALLVFGLFGLF